jgi:predicted transcriptional regulator
LALNNWKPLSLKLFIINMIDELNKRIIEVMVRTEHSKSTFAKALDVSLPLITHLTTGRNKPGLDIIQKLLLHFEQISPDWLLLGVGAMYREKPKQQDFTPIISQIEALTKQIDFIQDSQISVIQYHKILLDEVKHLEEMDQLIENDKDSLVKLKQSLGSIRDQLLSN